MWKLVGGVVHNTPSGGLETILSVNLVLFLVKRIALIQSSWFFFDNPFKPHFRIQNIGLAKNSFDDLFTNWQAIMSLKGKFKNIFSVMCWNPGFWIIWSMFSMLIISQTTSKAILIKLIQLPCVCYDNKYILILNFNLPLGFKFKN